LFLIHTSFSANNRQKCQALFEPREDRAPLTNPEHVTGTHWFAHFQDYAIPAASPSSSNTIHNIGRMQHILTQEDGGNDVFGEELVPLLSQRIAVIEVSYLL